MTEREKIMGRIREALTLSAPKPGAHGVAEHHSATTARPVSGARQWLPLAGNNFDEQAALFRVNAIELKADFHLLNNAQEASDTLLKLRASEGWQRVASHNGSLTNSICEALGLPLLRTDGSYDVHELEKCDVGVTECDALIAQTGSVLVTSRSAGGRALSVLPPHHVVLARRDQMLPDLTAAFELVKEKYSANYPSFISLITGPSRTGDIERILVLGAHGPKKLTILCF